MRSRRTVRAAVLLAACVMAAMPASAQRAPKEKDPAPGKPAPASAEPATGATELAERFGAAATGRSEEGLYAVLEAAIDYDALAARSLEGLELSATERGEVANGLIQGMKQNGGLGNQLGHMILRFLRVKTIGGEPKLVFGTASMDGALNYLLFDYEIRGDAVRIVDLYPLATGEQVSATMRRMILPLLSQRDATLLSRMFGRDDTKSILAGYATMGKMSAYAQQSDWEAVVTAYESLDPEVRQEKLAMVMGISGYAMLENDTRLTELTAAYEKRFPHDASLPLMTFDAHVTAGRHREALAGLKAVDAMIGGDPFLDTYRAGVYLEQGRLDEALKHARAGAEGAPEIELAHWQLATVAATAKDYATLVATFRELSDFGYYFVREALTDPTYAAFLTSPQAKRLFEEESKRLAADGLTLDDLGFE